MALSIRAFNHLFRIRAAASVDNVSPVEGISLPSHPATLKSTKLGYKKPGRLKE
jgi:hypothetical protein